MNTVLIILIIVSAILFIAVIALLILVLKKEKVTFDGKTVKKEFEPAVSSVWVEFVEKGVIITRIITAALLATAIYMWVNGIELDDTLRACLLIVIGFFFNGEITTEIIRNLLKKNEVLIKLVKKGG